jgi:hypothetical protein
VAPDGRLFVCEIGGTIRIIKDGLLLEQPFGKVDPTIQRGARPDESDV